ncbi:MAG TPA: vanadium-dependent haloperoxidase [Nocardioides sp.]|uniref:vanadium-dependent haloperoxidase n=1 Tax=Nocardioides sp. TaxID=35761 RepID=UPI002E3037BB|nr:vanadium-dependent haloperoxidase [Nocardioides sp.]HEX5090973.1 vanadium-dependent haloperoxidase [Nocardioides sp.]
MHLVKRFSALFVTASLTAAVLTAVPPGATATASATTDQAPTARTTRAQVVLNWERIAFRTVYVDAATPIPVGVPVLGYTSLAVHRAVQTSLGSHRESSERAAVVAAAYQVLQHYYPKLRGKLGADRAAGLASVEPGPAKRFGVKVGKRAARGLIDERRDDGYLDPTIHYSKPPGVGVWQPPASGDMLAAWLGSMKPLVTKKRVGVDGPDPLTSAAYASQFEEVKSLGSATSTTRTEAQRQTALFFNYNAATAVADAVIRYLEGQGHPLTLAETARLFAALHAAMTDSLIQCWQHKRDVGFWRPSQAIAGAANDGNPSTNPPATTWTPLLPNPPYSDYVSGHGCLTGPAVEVVRKTLGEKTPLELVSPNSPTHRTYPTLRGIEQDAFMARIWSGLHFRTAMADSYRIGHITARRVLAALD